MKTFIRGEIYIMVMDKRLRQNIRKMMLSILITFITCTSSFACVDSVFVKKMCLLQEYNLENSFALFSVRKDYVFVATDSTGVNPDYFGGIFLTVHKAAGFYSSSTSIKEYQAIWEFVINNFRKRPLFKSSTDLILYPKKVKNKPFYKEYNELCGKFTCFYLGNYEFYLPPIDKSSEPEKAVIPHYLILQYESD